MVKSKARSGNKTAVVLPEGSAAKMKHWLERAGYELRPLSQHPQLAVVDLTDPAGSKELAALRRYHPELAVLAVVGDSHDEAKRGLKLGADGFVAKGALSREFDLRLEAVHRLAAARIDQGRREQDLAVLLDLTADYASALDVATLLHDVTRRLAEELSIDRCALVLLDEERQQGHIVAASDDRALKDVTIDLSRYPEIREAVRTDRPVVVDDVGSHPLLGEVKEAVTRRGIAALAAVPLTVQKKTLGVLLLRASGGGKLQESEINFAWTVAHATAIALRNAKMLEGLRGQAERAQAQLAELARYEEFFQYVSDGIAILDDQGALASLNPAGAAILGLPPEQARGRMFASFATALSEVEVMEMMASSRSGAVCREHDLEVMAVPDRRLMLSVSCSAIEGGKGLILSFRDVTDARAMERELRKTKEFLEKLINSSVDAIIASDMKGQIILYNRSAERILGYSAEEAVGKIDVRRLYPEGMARQLMRFIESEEHGGAGRLDPTRTEVVSRNGERVPVLLSAALIYEGDAPVATMGVFSDLRERTKLEARLSKAQERLEEAEKQAVIVELAGTAAHELNQPLTSVMGYAELLKRKLKPEDAAFRSVDIIYREAERMAEIVRKIGKITRYETKAYVGNSRIVDLDRAAGGDEEPGHS